MNRDHFARRAKQEGFASRAAYKLEEIQRKHRIIKPGDRVIDLGAAPGGWLAIIAKAVGQGGRVVGVDLVPVAQRFSAQVTVVQADFTGEEGKAVIAEAVASWGAAADLVTSDAAPSTSGIRFRDAALSAELGLGVLAICQSFLRPQGSCLLKVFAGDEEELLKQFGQLFHTTKRLKPEASRRESREFYLLGRGFRRCNAGE